MNSVPGPSSAEAVLEHIAAFNAHDRVRLLAGLAADATWLTGRDSLHGHAALAEMFDDGLWALNPSLRVLRLVAEAQSVAVEMVETLTVDDEQQVCPIACFFDLQGATIRRVKVFREGSADIT